MATVFNTEKSQFMQSAAKIFSENKTNQYSKYLDTNPIMVTYYSVNEVMTRADIATGQIYDELGVQSPLRFNKILNFPIYHLGTIQPNQSFEDGHFDAEIDISDIVILPNTIKPKPYDFILLELPNSRKLLLRVNSFRNNTIQSNDFYQIDADLRREGDDCNADIEKLVVETYNCIFENIGTQDSCFIKSTDEEIANRIYSVITQLIELYKSIYYNESTADFIYTEEYEDPVAYWDPYHKSPNRYFYDIYLTKFINESGIFTTNDYSQTSALVYDDTLPRDFDYKFKLTLWDAILTKSTKLLKPYPYCHYPSISKVYSPLITERMISSYGIEVVIGDSHNPNSDLEEYFNHKLLKALINQELLVDPSTAANEKMTVEELSVCSLSDITNGMEKGDMVYARDKKAPYLFRPQYVPKDPRPDPAKPITEADKDFNEFFVCYQVIADYLSNTKSEIDYDKLIQILYTPSMVGYRITPIIIYILKKKYKEYFSTTI